MAQTARISSRSDAIIQEMISLTGYSKVEVIERALETYRRNQRMRLMNQAYQRLQSSAILKEISSWLHDLLWIDV